MPNNEHWGVAEHKFNRYSALVDGNLTKEDLEESSFWMHTARKLQAGDEIRCLSKDSNFVAELIVLFVNGNDAKIRCSRFDKLRVDAPATLDIHPDYEIKNGGAAGWYVKDKRDGSRLFDKGFKSDKEALRELKEYLQALAA